MTYIKDRDIYKIIYVHYCRKYGSHALAIDQMTVDIIEFEEKEMYEQCEILLDTIKKYE